MSFERPRRIEFFFDAMLNHGLGRSLYKRSAKEIGLEGNEEVLDFGAGSGALSRHVAEILLSGGGKVTCLDTSAAWTAIARKRLKKYRNIQFVVGDLRNLNIEAASFNVVVVHLVLHEIGREKRQGTVEALSRTLKDGGRLFIKEPTKVRHGVPTEEIRQLMTRSGLTETWFSISRSLHMGPLYTGVFGKSA